MSEHKNPKDFIAWSSAQVLNCANLAKENMGLQKDEMNDVGTQLKETMQQLLQLERKQTNIDKAISDLHKAVQHKEEMASTNDVRTLYEELEGKVHKKHPPHVDTEQHEIYRALVEVLDPVCQEGPLNTTGELAVTVDSLPILDPITKKRIVKPVRNKQCRHIYDKDSILQMLNTSKKMMCPIVGCANTNRFTKEDLVEDPALTFRYSQMTN